mmetsp:Transcript_18621/g.33828  ORF Transcript_18621/g.33828 Transcript_18621/m.33828 type:complete len:322 (-) Transcript_18621:515-1480(-)|eukprot:CAMPEP_0175058558 /NCGR_PEP_ID=MMETSP0052_2-20121109/11916_1 /TAXON_ID=51329 ORGANISM="Polytomella parva, Strain SAG 63-3" /NCGR_SAMPLE_ID=MMETSP0052_2 /ASSEMBLY_ACC=CAM_ASM_000194 /LENGTH=321 /DNA_ID=CAMNT_0016323955 /DNA_START=32 /DNA_END=997 /DNA_ORIENTATION=+
MVSEGSGILVFKTVEEVRKWSKEQQRAGKTIALVPTMGYLHRGHMSLVELAKKEADVVIGSVYVNPTQFSANEDFDVYPRDIEGDRAKLASAGAVAVFEPDTLYFNSSNSLAGDSSNVVGRGNDEDPMSHETYVIVDRLQRPLCGASRPHHFRGVATIVTKLLHIVAPDILVLGRKDFQQWKLVERMVRDLDFDVRVIGAPICREEDGLAMSSRNTRLSAESRVNGLALSRALKWAKEAAAAGDAEARNPVALEARVRREIENAGGRVDYATVLDGQTLTPVKEIKGGRECLLALAAWFPAGDGGAGVRLIDNDVIVNPRD